MNLNNLTELRARTNAMHDEQNVQYNTRIPKRLKDEFFAAAAKIGLKPSELIPLLIEDAVRQINERPAKV